MQGHGTDAFYDGRGMMPHTMPIGRVAAPTLIALALVFMGPVLAVGRQGLLAPLPLTADAPADNPGTLEKIELGRLLFWDPVLSGHGDVACATCHHPRFAYADGRALALGAGATGLGPARRRDVPRRSTSRNAPTLLNVAFNGIGVLGAYRPADAPMFWDLRAAGLEAQVRHPLTSRDEMRGDAHLESDALDGIVTRLSAIPEYRDRFARVFGGDRPITSGTIARALAAFERSLVAADAPFDRYLRGDVDAMNAAAVRGMRQFETLGCSNCHKGPMLSDYAAHVIGVPDHPEREYADAGMAGLYAFRTPSLRNVALTAPYMHSGVFLTLDEVLAFYDTLAVAGGRRSSNPYVADEQLDPLLGRLIAGGGRDLIAFLEALTDDAFDRTAPDRVPSGLNPGGTEPFSTDQTREGTAREQ